jgi:hypothetical protein
MIRAPLIAVLLLAACAAPPAESGSATGDPSGSAAAESTPSMEAETPATDATPSPAPSASGPAAVVAPPTDVLPLHAMIRATADGLRVRMGPSTSSDVVATVNAGDILYITGASSPQLAPIQNDGYEWYPVEYAPGYTGWPARPAQEDLVMGALAARSGSDWFVELVAPRCPDAPPADLAGLVALTGYERVACLGDETLTVEGTFRCPFCDSLAHSYATEPVWLAEWTIHLDMLVPSWSGYPPFPGSIVLATPPDVPPLERVDGGSILRVTGHFNDERSTTCTITPGPKLGDIAAVSAEAAEWYCRERFVVESWEVIGTDPAFEGLIPG